MTHRSVVFLFVVLGALAPSLVSAAPKRSADRNTTPPDAREHAKKGYSLYGLGKFLEASVEFEAAYEAKSEAGLLYNAAQSARLGGDLRKARTLYSSYISFHPDGANLVDAKGHLEKLDQQISLEESARKSGQSSDGDVPIVEPPPRDSGSARSDKPVYKKWWLWVAVVGGVAVVATAVTLGVVLTRPAPSWSNEPDIGPKAPAATSLQIHF